MLKFATALISLSVLSATYADEIVISKKLENLKPYEQVHQLLWISDEVVPLRPDIHPSTATYNREAVIPPQCYTKTEGRHNPCYVCHQDKIPERENVMNDGGLQAEYSFSDVGLNNHWKNLFKNRSAQINDISNEEITAWVNQDNYSELPGRLKETGFSGWIPDLKNLQLGADAFDNDETTEPRTGKARWIPMTDKFGTPLTSVDPFLNAGSSRFGRDAADELGATPYGRPEDIEVGMLANGKEVLYFTATSEATVYSVQMNDRKRAKVRIFADEANTPKNLGFPATTGILNSPDNLAQDVFGNIYIIEDKPNSDEVGGDIWFARDVDGDGVAESIDHLLSIQVDEAEATGMISNPKNPAQFVVSVQHPETTDERDPALGKGGFGPDGFGDALWKFDIKNVVPPICKQGARYNRHSYNHEHHIQTCSELPHSH